MSLTTAVIVAFVACIFCGFALVLFWAERRTHGISPHFYPPADPTAVE